MKLRRLVGAIMIPVGLVFAYYGTMQGLQVLGYLLAISGLALIIVSFVWKGRRTIWIPEQANGVHYVVKQPMGPRSSDLKSEKSDRILRTLPDENAFYFYKMLHYYLDVKASSLVEFLEKLRTVDAESIVFHVSRGDFAKWIGTSILDSDLAQSVSRLGESSVARSSEELRMKLADMVQTRLASLRSF